MSFLDGELGSSVMGFKEYDCSLQTIEAGTFQWIRSSSIPDG